MEPLLILHVKDNCDGDPICVCIVDDVIQVPFEAFVPLDVVEETPLSSTIWVPHTLGMWAESDIHAIERLVRSKKWWNPLPLKCPRVDPKGSH